MLPCKNSGRSLGPESIEELMADGSQWLEPGEANYEMKPFAISADGGTWGVLNDDYLMEL